MKTNVATDRSPLLASTPESAPEKPTAYLVLVAGMAVLSAFNYGYHIGVMNTPELVIRACNQTDTESALPPCFEIESTLWGIIIAVFALGGMVGGMFGGGLADRYGRLPVMMWNNLTFIIGTVFLCTATSEVMLIIGRILVGIGSGIATTVVPTFVGEITPANLRGAFGVLFQLSITVGILIAQVLGLYMSTVELWRWLLSIGGFIAAFQMVGLLACVESPRYLLLRGDATRAESALRRLYGRSDVGDVLATIQTGIESSGTEKYSIMDLLRDRSLLRPLLISTGLLIAQQLSGINAVFYYSTSIFQNVFPDAADRLTVSVGLLNVLLTVITVFLMDRAGRRVLLIICEVGMIIFATLFVVSFVKDIDWLNIVCVYAYVASFAIGLGPIPYLILSEIIPTKAVGSAASLGLSLNWASNFAVALLFPLMAEGLGDYSFLPFAAAIVVFLILTLLFVPETKGRSLEEITKGYGDSGRDGRINGDEY